MPFDFRKLFRFPNISSLLICFIWVLIFASLIPDGCRGDNYRKKGVSPNQLQFSIFPIAPRTAASCAQRIYGSTEILLSFVNSPPGAGRRCRRGRRKYAEDFQRKGVKNFQIGLPSQRVTKKRLGFPEVFSGSDLCAFGSLR
jgi:hypothetical protein